MVDAYRLAGGAQRDRAGDRQTRSPDRALKDFRYVVASVNDEALKIWGDLWKEFQGGVTPSGLVGPEMHEGFKPPCGWPEFLEKFWVLKHYLDYTHRFCKDPIEQPKPSGEE